MFYVNVITFFIGIIIMQFIIYKIEGYLKSKKLVTPVGPNAPKPFISGIKDDS